MTSRRLLAPLLALAVLLVGGCVGVPDQGPVVDLDSPAAQGREVASARDALPPEKGATTVAVVSGFLDAMQAWPVDVTAARAYLDSEAASSWNPESATVIYTDNLPPQDRTNAVTVQLSGAERIDGRGSWRGPLPVREQTLRFDLVLEDGEYRISNPPDALLVPASWFAQRYRQVSLYYFDPTGQVLVPEPVFVPRGQQLVSTLTERLLQGPEPAPRAVARTFFPPGLSVGLSVTVSDDGLADIALTGAEVPQADATVERMLAQLAWTLRQEPAVTALRISIGGQPLPLPDGGQTYPVDGGQRFDPNGYLDDVGLWALRDGVLVTGDVQGVAPVPGPWGTEVAGLRSVAVDLDGSQAAGVSADGTELLTAPTGDVPRRQRGTSTVWSGATDLLEPVWDFSGRLWALDRTAAGAEVRYVQDGRLRTLRVPGVSGLDVTSFLVSRDATRFVAVVRTAGTDQVRTGRIRIDGGSRVVGALRATTILGGGVDGGAASSARIRDVGWTSPTSVAVLSQVVREEVYDISTVPVDGAPTSSDADVSSVQSGTIRSLAVSPVPAAVPYAITTDGVVDLATNSRVTLRDQLDSLGYVG